MAQSISFRQQPMLSVDSTAISTVDTLYLIEIGAELDATIDFCCKKLIPKLNFFRSSIPASKPACSAAAETGRPTVSLLSKLVQAFGLLASRSTAF